MNTLFMMEFTSSRSVIMRIPATPVSPDAKLETNLQPKLTTHNSSLASQFMKCNFFSLVVATPDVMVDTSLRSLIAHHNTKATNS